MTIAELRTRCSEILSVSLPRPEAEADYLISGFLKISLAGLHLDSARLLTPEQCEKLLFLASRRKDREPAQYLIGHAPFRELELEVNPDVLIPRPETEELVSFLLKHTPPGGKVLDIGTGSGAIAVSAAYERADLQVTAVDVSEKALQTARRNAAGYGLEERIDFLHSDLFSGLSGCRFHFIAANLPYVSESSYRQCEPEIFFEPRLALTAPDEGMALMKKCINDLPDHLYPGGKAIFELAPEQNEIIRRCGEAAGLKSGHLRDMEGKERFVILEMP